MRDHGTLIDGRCIWVSMQIGDLLIGLLCIYAPNEARLRANFWQDIVDVLPVVDSWIVGGDFNNLESPSDYRADTPPHLPDIAPAEIDAWDSFLFALRLSDAWHEHSFTHTEGSLHFSWGFRRQAGRLLERLDRFYIGAWAAGIGGSMMIWPGTALSDHAPVSIRILAQRPDAPRRGCRIPDVILSSDTLQAELQGIWSTTQSTLDHACFITECLAASSETCRHHAIARRRFLRASEQGLHIRLASVHRLQE